MIDPLEFRRAAGLFPTGVTVVTTLDADGAPVGLTANSFTTVSLDPPLVLVCVEGGTVPAFDAGNGFVVHLLGADQEPLSRHFATPGVDRFEGVAWNPGRDGLPVLGGALAVFECSLWAAHDGGDHRIYLGAVEQMSISGEARPALGYFRGEYFSV